MKKGIILLFKEYFIVIIFFVFIVTGGLLNFSPAKQITKNFLDFLVEMVLFIPFMFVLIGLFDVWVPKEKIQKYIGEGAGIKGIVMVILLAMLQAGPLYGAFPVAYILWKKGCSVRNIFIYLGAFSSLKLPMLTFEIAFLGLKFSLVRTLVTIPTFIIISEIINIYLRDKKFEIRNVEKAN
jgi:uncharacterized membrane protein YraQ (UPF0718 family)